MNEKVEQKLREMIRTTIKDKLKEDYKNSEWEVYLRDEKGNEKIVKKAKSKRAATILYNRIIKSDDYYEVGMRAIKEGKLSEKKIKPKQKMSKKDWRKIAKFNKHIGQDGTHYVMQLTNKGTALVPVTVEQKIREQIREIIEEQLNEKKETNFQMNTRDMREVDKLLRKGKFKGLKMKAKGPKFILTVPKKMEDEVLSYLIQKNVKNINEV